MKKQFVVIGLGRFGSSICKELHQLGHDVLAIDIKPERVYSMEDYSSHAVMANATDETTLKSLGVTNFDYAVVAIGENMQPSILCTLMLKELGVNKVWAKAINPEHRKVLERIGADRIIQPEIDMGLRIAHQLDSSSVIEYVELSSDHSIVEYLATEKIDNKTLGQLNIRANYGITILAIKRGEHVDVSPSPDDLLFKGDILVAIGSKQDLNRFLEKGL